MRLVRRRVACVAAPTPVHAQTAIALLLALASTTLTNVAYLREHDAAAALPALSLRRPLHSAEALLTDRSWLVGFALESGGFALYVAALALAPLTLVQSVSAGGIGDAADERAADCRRHRRPRGGRAFRRVRRRSHRCLRTRHAWRHPARPPRPRVCAN